MAISPTYPGVYIEEVPSGVRTITGVSTSVAAFVGAAKQGPIGEAVRVNYWSDYERRFGGLAEASEMSFAVNQFFKNGGSQAFIVRLVGSAGAASRGLLYSSNNGDVALTLTARDPGLAGNAIEVWVDHQTDNPASTFNLTLRYVDAENSELNIEEKFDNLSMNSQDARYVVDWIKSRSVLVEVERLSPLPTLGQGTSISGALVDSSTPLDVATLVDATHNQLRIAVNGLPAVAIQIPTPTGANASESLSALCTSIQALVRAQALGRAALSSFACEPGGDDNPNTIVMTSRVGGEASTVRVLPGERNDASARLKLGTLNGGIERDAVAAIRPVEVPPRGRLVSGNFTSTGDLSSLPSEESHCFQISLNGYGPDPVNLGRTAVSGPDLGSRLTGMATLIQTTVRALRPSNEAYSGFTCTVGSLIGGNYQLILESGTRGAGSSVLVSPGESNDIAAALNLLVGGLSTAIATPGSNTPLTGGTEIPYGPTSAYSSFIADRSRSEGIYALDKVDLFNLLCLPGITDPGILMDAAAYCEEKRAFLIADAPPEAETPDAMETTIRGTALPKTRNGAVYYPWFKVANPLKGGSLRPVPPCGTIAGLYARTDNTRGVWKAPAGTEATLTGLQELAYKLSDRENGILNPLGVNCLRSLPVYGVVAWGARTLRGADQLADEYKYVPIRRLALFIEESLYRGLQWVVFEPNDEPLWAQIRLNVGAFMNTLFRQGAFQGLTPRQAYFVKCDRETTTQADINLGIVNIVVGFAPLKPAEFVIIKIQQIAGQLQT